MRRRRHQFKFTGLRAWAIWLLAALAFAAMPVESAGLADTSGPDRSWITHDGTINDATVHIENRIGLSSIAPDQFAIADGKTTTVVMADSLVFSTQTFSSALNTCPRNLVIIADTVRLDGVLTIDLSRDRGDTVAERAGGSFILIAHTLYFGDQGFLKVNTSAGYRWMGIAPPWVKPGQDGGSGGSTDIIVDQVLLSERKTAGLVDFLVDPLNSLLRDLENKPFEPAQKQMWLAQIDEAFPDPTYANAFRVLIQGKETYDFETLRLLAHIRKEMMRRRIEEGSKEQYLQNMIVCDTSGGYAGAGGKPGAQGRVHTVIGVGKDSLEQECTRLLAADWLSSFLRSILTVALTKGVNAAQDRRSLISLFRQFDALPPFPVANTPFASDYLQLLNQFTDMRRKKVLPVWVETVPVPQSQSVPLPATVVFHEAETDGYVVPTDALLVPFTENGKDWLGSLMYDSASPDVMTVTFTAELIVGTPIATKLGAILKVEGEHVAGTFTECTLVATGTAPGLRSMDLKMNGTRLNCKLTLDNSDLAEAVLSQLASPAGLPVTLAWTSTKDPEVSGIPMDMRLSIARRTSVALEQANGILRNASDVAVTLDWTEVGDDIIPVRVRFEPGETKPIAQLVPDHPDLQRLSIAPEALAYESRGSGFLTAFRVPESLVTRYLVANLVPANDDSLGSLQCLDVILTSITGEGTAIKSITMGPYCLQPAGSTHDTVSIPVLKFGGQPARVFITGTARYEKGTLSLTQQEVKGSSLFVTKAMLK